MSIVNVSKSDIIERLSKEIKRLNEFKPPLWALFVKTGAHTERPPTNPDWWFIRVASILIKINDLGPVGVSKLRVKYGGKKNRGMAPEQFKKSGGKIIRLILQQLEKAGFAKQVVKGLHRGRVITPKGISFVEKVSFQIMKENNIVLPKKVVVTHVQHAHSPEKLAEKPGGIVEQKIVETQATITGESVVKTVEEQKVKKTRSQRKSRKKTEEVIEPKSEAINE